MTEPSLAYDRPRLLDALRRTAGSDEEAVLEAARQASAIISAARLTWDDLLVPALAMPEAGLTPVSTLAPADDGARIAALLALPQLSAEARESLEELARDLAAGTVREEDRVYLNGLFGRLIAAS